MAMSGQNYPDLSQPRQRESVSTANAYPDLSQPNAAPEQNPMHHDNILSSMWDKSMDFMQPKKEDSHGYPMIDTFVGRLPDPNYADNKQDMHNMLKLTQQDMQKSAALMTIMMAPELKIASMLPASIRAVLPEVTGGLKVAKNMIGSAGKTAVGSYLGTKMMPGSTDEQAENAGAIGGGTAALTTPLMMFLGSQNPLIRYLAGGGLGALTGYGASHLTGGTPYATGLGAAAGALMGGRGAGARETAAQNAYNAMTTKNWENATARVPAAAEANVPLNMAEATGSPTHAEMYSQAAGNKEGAKVIYPWAMNREDRMNNAYQDTLGHVSPTGSTSPEEQAFTEAGKVADQKGTRVDVSPIVDYIDSQLPKYEAGSKMSQALNQAKARLGLTPQTAASHQRLMEPVTNMQTGLQQHSAQLRQQISQMEAQAPDAYFRASSGYDQKLKSLKSELSQNESALQQLSTHRDNFMQANDIGNYENTVGGLHNAKMGINGIIEGQGESAVGKTAAGKLKQVNKRLTAAIKEASPEYAQATHMANMRMARNDIEKSMEAANSTGSDFYNRILQNDTSYKKLYDRLADPKNPLQVTDAQRALGNLKTAMPDLMDNMVARSGKTLAEKPEMKTKLLDIATSMMNKMFMNKYQKAVAELMTNPNWQQELANVARMRAGEDRGIRLGRLIAKVAATGNAANNNQQGSQQYGGEPR